MYLRVYVCGLADDDGWMYASSVGGKACSLYVLILLLLPIRVLEVIDIGVLDRGIDHKHRPSEACEPPREIKGNEFQ